jgi:hypothetical protein
MRLGVIPTVAPYVLPRIVGRLAARYPGLDLQLRETVTSRLIGELAEGSLDAAILALPVGETAFEEVPSFHRILRSRPPGRGSRPPGAQPRTAARNALLLLEEGHCFRDQALSFCNMTSSAPREMMDGSSLSTLVQMVGAGLGVTLIPEMAVDIETRSADVSVDGFDAPGPERTIGMIWRRSNPLERTIAGDERHCPRSGNRRGLAQFFLRRRRGVRHPRPRRHAGEALQISRHPRQTAVQRLPLIQRVIAQLLKIQYARPDVGLGLVISVSCKHRRDRIEPRGVGGIDTGAQPSSRRAHSRTAKSRPGSNRSGSMKHSKKLQTAPVIVVAQAARSDPQERGVAHLPRVEQRVEQVLAAFEIPVEGRPRHAQPRAQRHDLHLAHAVADQHLAGAFSQSCRVTFALGLIAILSIS